MPGDPRAVQQHAVGAAHAPEGLQHAVDDVVVLGGDIGFSGDRVDALSPSGRCRPFDAAADGVLRGEGCALVVLRRLADAMRDGDTVHAIVRGSALGHDGHSSGLTVPSTEAQIRLGREALAAAGLDGRDVDVVEAHATGTQLGDPIELSALKDAFAGPSPAVRDTCALGSAKPNLGHLDVASGLVGLVKAMGVVERGMIPPVLHFEKLNPSIDLSSTPFFVPTTLTKWPNAASPRIAGVSAFGIGGTNAHLVLEEHPPRGISTSRGRPELFVFSTSAEEMFCV